VLDREDVDQLTGPVLLEFGANWCGICRAFSLDLAELFREFPQVTHIRVEDGRGKRLGRSFRVKLWPTLVFLKDGQVVSLLVRPTADEAREGFQKVTSEMQPNVT
jgi:thioredoxin 1